MSRRTPYLFFLIAFVAALSPTDPAHAQGLE